MKKIRLLFTCEHAVNFVPDEYRDLFRDHQDLLVTHRGIDLGALTIAQAMQGYFQAPLIGASVTRLLIDCNRSLVHSKCFSEISATLSKHEKQQVIDNYYTPYRQQVEQTVSEILHAGDIVLHLSVHSFTPILHGYQRNADFALLYDPTRCGEKHFAKNWRHLLLNQPSPLKVRMNYPYRGISNGFTTTLRRKFPTDDYWGIELECNQAIAQHPVQQAQLIDSLTATLNEWITQGEHHGKAG